MTQTPNDSGLSLPLDPERFFELIETLEMTPEDIKSVVFERYIKTIEDVYPTFAEFMTQGDAVGVRAKAHQLKGSSLNAGAKTLATTYMELEDMGKRGDLSQAQPVLDRAQDEFVRFKDYVASDAYPPKPNDGVQP